ncbi:heat shock protein HslJ [Kribbella voronezhensis]|uniref:Heat shock protein HslJ n=1 Tax=Kribbella voronezhensis TaxID=2512212 RepID=A0A4R7THF8_9ACTN|nr:META domain-containing protein [Kribbella voronezhensis]TDU90968.1 heat shock protein HslJ [Kribbella voronezhensis]
MIAAVVVAGLAVALSGCGDESGTGGSTLQGKSYLSTAVTENGKPKQLAPKTRIQLQFLPDGRLSANAGCNSMGADKVTTSGGRLGVKDLTITDMGCDAPRHAQDDWLSKLLTSGPTWKLTGDKLKLSSGTTVISLVDRATAVPDLPLDGTKWTLDTVVSGETASHSMDADKVHFTISGERVTGSTGCNDFQGIVSHTGDKLTFGELGTTRRACTGDAATLEKTVLDALKGDVVYDISSGNLQLSPTNAPGTGLSFIGSR